MPRTGRTFIKAKMTLAGIHKWPKAPERVFYLAKEHRHLFTFIATLTVKHSNRSVEFITLADSIRRYIDRNYSTIGNGVYDFEDQSCEMLAEQVCKHFKLDNCEVWEDMENCGGYEI